MVFVNDKKYSCEPCIKGHRSSTCKHTDRPLFEIKKKGRPVTQCEHCRKLRKTKAVHIRCICGGKSSTDDAPKRKKGDLHNVLASVAFPDGLPEALEASVAERALSEPSSDEDRAARSHTCSCKDDEECYCYTTKRPRRKSAENADATMPGFSSGLMALSSRRSSASASLRPVLPKPPQQLSSDMTPRIHRPALPRPTHGSAFFSPYGRAYTDHFTSPEAFSHMANRTLEANLALPPLTSDQTFQTPYDPVSITPFLSTSQSLPHASFPDFSQWSGPSDFGDLGNMPCICGDACTCPGCIQHRGMDAWFNRGCDHPEACTTCLLPVPSSARPSTPPTTPLGGDPAVDFAALDEWIRSIPNEGSSAVAPDSNPNPDVGFDVFGGSTDAYSASSFMDINSTTIPSLQGPPEDEMDPSLFSFGLSHSEPNSAYEGNDPGLMFDFEEGPSVFRRRASSTSSLSSFSPSVEEPPAISSDEPSSSRPHIPKASSTTSLLPLSLLSMTNVFSSRSATDVVSASGGGSGFGGGNTTGDPEQTDMQLTRHGTSMRSRGRGATARATFYQAAMGRMS